MRPKAIFPFLCITILFSGCASLESLPTATIPSTAPSTPTATYTDTPAPSLTLTETPTPGDSFIPVTTHVPITKPPDISLFLPTGRAASEWNGIPIMPNAFAGKESEDKTGYQFWVKGNVALVQRYYNVQLPGLGWALFNEGDGEGGSRIIAFKQGSSLLSIEIVEVDEAERFLMVMLVLIK